MKTLLDRTQHGDAAPAFTDACLQVVDGKIPIEVRGRSQRDGDTIALT